MPGTPGGGIPFTTDEGNTSTDRADPGPVHFDDDCVKPAKQIFMRQKRHCEQIHAILHQLEDGLEGKPLERSDRDAPNEVPEIGRSDIDRDNSEDSEDSRIVGDCA